MTGGLGYSLVASGWDKGSGSPCWCRACSPPVLTGYVRLRLKRVDLAYFGWKRALL